MAIESRPMTDKEIKYVDAISDCFKTYIQIDHPFIQDWETPGAQDQAIIININPEFTKIDMEDDLGFLALMDIWDNKDVDTRVYLINAIINPCNFVPLIIEDKDFDEDKFWNDSSWRYNFVIRVSCTAIALKYIDIRTAITTTEQGGTLYA